MCKGVNNAENGLVLCKLVLLKNKKHTKWVLVYFEYNEQAEL